MKSMLVVKGFPLYTQIWSDQPPFFTYALALMFKIIGFEVNAGRVFVLFLSSILLGSAFLFLQRVWSNWHAIAGAILIILLPHYLRLSVSNMVGLPALAFALLSLSTLVIWHQQRNQIWLVLSAFVLSLSLLTKIFTGLLIPIFLIGLLIGEYKQKDSPKGWISRLSPILIWCGVLVGSTLSLAIMFVGPKNLTQLVMPHLVASNSRMTDIIFDSMPIEWHLQGSLLILSLGIIGVIIAIIKRSWLSFYLISWMGVSYLLLTNYSPVWYHHQLIITIPAAMLGGIAVGEVAYATFGIKRHYELPTYVKLLLISGALIFLVALITRFQAIIYEYNQKSSQRFVESGTLSVDERILKRMSTHANETNWVFTDLPIYPFRVGLKVPPELGVISAKRILTGTLTEEKILSILQERQPEQILLGRFEYPSMDEYIERNYKLLFSMEGKRLFLRNDL